MREYKLKSTPQAWNFVRGVVGYGFNKDSQPTVPKADIDNTLADKCKQDILDYSRFDHIEDASSENEESSDTKKLNLLNKNNVSTDEVADLLGLNGAVNQPPFNTAPIDVNETQDTSEYFDPKKNPVMQGCAHDRSKERELYDRPTDEKIVMAKRFRLDGNEFFKRQDYEMAGAHYQKALIFFEYTFPDTPEQEKDLDQNKLSTHLNLAAVHLELKNFRDCIVQCDQALKIQHNCAKAFFRKAQAELQLDEFDAAENLFKEALRNGDENDLQSRQKIAHQIALVQRKRRNYEQDKPQIFRQMFHGALTEDSLAHVPAEEPCRTVLDATEEQHLSSPVEMIGESTTQCETAEADEVPVREVDGGLTEGSVVERPVVQRKRESLAIYRFSDEESNSEVGASKYSSHQDTLECGKNCSCRRKGSFTIGGIIGVGVMAVYLALAGVYIERQKYQWTGDLLLKTISALLPLTCLTVILISFYHQKIFG